MEVTEQLKNIQVKSKNSERYKKIGNYGMIFIINSVRYTNYKVVGK